MALPFDVANFNLVNFAEVYNDLFDSDPKDVTINVKDADGNITTKTVANRGKLKQQLWDDVGGALGQLSKTVYVDSVNGNDLNDGSSANPLKTLKKAIDTIPTGGVGRIFLDGNKTYRIEENIDISGKAIRIYEKVYGNKYNIDFAIYDNGTNRFVPGFKNMFAPASISIHGAEKIRCIDETNSTNSFAYMNMAMFGQKPTSDSFAMNVTITSSAIENLISGTKIFQNTYSGLFNVAIYGTSLKILSDKTVPFIEIGSMTTLSLSVAALTAVDENDNNINIADYIFGVVKDTNGIPRNVISNLIL